MTYFVKKLSILFALLGLSSCSMLSPVKVEPSSTYVLNSIPTAPLTKQTHPITILVMQPETTSAYNTTQMAYTIKPYQIAYFVQNRWAETPAQMLQPLIVQTLQNTHYFHAVVTPPYIGRYNYVLNTQVLQLQQDFTRRPAVLRLTLRAQLSNATTNQVIATKQFDLLKPIPQKTPYGGVIAANFATTQLLRELSRFCIEKIGRA